MKWPTVRARRVLRALLRKGWQKGSHKILEKSGWPDATFALHDREEISPRMLMRIAKHTGLMPDDL